MKIILMVLIIFAESNSGACREITVCSGCEFSSIAEAVRTSNDGDVIIVKQGYYKESGIIIDKRIRITGIGNPVIDLDFVNEGFVIRKDSVVISGIEIRNINVNYMKDIAGIRIENSNGCIIEDNVLSNTFFAIYLANSVDCIVRRNRITGKAETESSSGNGIHLWKCSRITIEGNETSGHRDGIYFEFVTGTSVVNNFSHGNLRYGLHFMFSDSCSYSENRFTSNGAGVAVMYTKNIFMFKNKFEHNWGPASYGLLLKEISRSKITGNIFLGNTTGLFMEGSDNLHIERNEFRDNGWAMKILGNCTDDTVTMNNFTGNTFDVSTNSSRSENFYSGNYWDKYNGYDLDNDNRGDVPYRPVSMYSMMIEKVPESIIMLRSLVVDILDVTEKIMPSLIPETLIDNQPKMTYDELN